MKSEWEEVKLKKLAIINNENYSKQDAWKCVQYLDTGSITKGIIDSLTYIDLEEEKLPSRARRKIIHNDIVYSTVRPNQEHYGIIESPISNMLVSTGFATITAGKKIKAKYLYYFITQSRITKYLQSIAEQRVSTYPALNRADIEDIVVTLPPLPTQRAIADTLSCLDAKIELNNKINRNLEAQAQAIFKSWFVDFEPFKNGEFVESELGLIPKGWQVGRLGDFITVKYGKDHKKLKNGNIPVYGSGGIMRHVDTFLYDKETVLIPRKGTLNNVMYINHPFWSVDTMFYTEINKVNFSKYLFQLVDALDLASMNVGSAVPSMTVALLNDVAFILPSDDELRKYENIIDTYYKSMQNNIQQSTTLATLRDLLLPKLMSGEITVPTGTK